MCSESEVNHERVTSNFPSMYKVHILSKLLNQISQKLNIKYLSEEGRERWEKKAQSSVPSVDEVQVKQEIWSRWQSESRGSQDVQYKEHQLSEEEPATHT